MADFIFMLTRDDVTIADAAARVIEVIATGIRHIGFKNIGLPWTQLRQVADAIRRAHATLYLEIVSLDAASEAESARAALQLHVDVLLGGTRPEIVLPVIAGTNLRYYPFPGTIVGHPSRLLGSTADIVASAFRLSLHPGVHGLDLLAYRADTDARHLIRSVCAAVGKPVIVAGSIDRAERVHEVVTCGAAGFTVGTAALNGVFPAGVSLIDQLGYIEMVLAELPPQTRQKPGVAASD
jgi:4-hydroxythreonine-4-phosphate dehydrogenase